MQRIGKGNLYLLAAGLAVLGLTLATAGPAAAQFATGFEASDGYVAGSNVDGQNGWYLPNGAGNGDDSQIVDTYSGGVLGLPQNPNGGAQYIGQVAAGDGNFPRAQLNTSFSGSTVWTVSYDTCVAYQGSGVAKNNISSFSLQPSDTNTAYFIQLNYWQHTVGRGGPNGHGVRWKAAFEVFNAAGNGPLIGLVHGKPARELFTNRWYNIQITFDLGANQITSIVYTDLTNGKTLAVQPTIFYLQGGAAGGLATPTAFRFFVGGGSGTDAGNVAGFDNLSVVPGGPGPIPGNAAHGWVELRPMKASLADNMDN